MPDFRKTSSGCADTSALLLTAAIVYIKIDGAKQILIIIITKYYIGVVQLCIVHSDVAVCSVSLIHESLRIGFGMCSGYTNVARELTTRTVAWPWPSVTMLWWNGSGRGM